MSRLSVIIITKNEQENLDRCLESVRFADEVVIIDSQSTDRTAEIAGGHGCKFHQLEWQGFGAAKQAALDRATGDWVLSIDADEAVSDGLREEIANVVSENDACDGYLIPRRTKFLGRWIYHCGWYPDYLLRLFKRTKGHFDRAVVHEKILVDGTVGKLRGDLLHYSYPNLEIYFEKSNRYTTLGAEEAFRTGKRAGWFAIVVKPPLAFFKHYIQKRGFLDGYQGFIVSVLSAGAVLAKYAKLWHLARKHDTIQSER